MTTIALNKLIPAKANVRRTGANDGIEELAASIAAHGLLTSLAVRKSARGKFAVIAGRRRYLALSLLAERDQLPADHPVLCQVVSGDADATEIGLAENVVRLAMHPADQFEAFRDLVDKGAGIADIAARFGVSEPTVAKRLKLGRVSPAILDAYRAGSLGLEQVQAFAVSDDRQAQERVFAACDGHHANPTAIRRALTEGEIPATDPRLCFIGMEAYEAAGGPVRHDLFDEEGGGYAQDAPLLDALVTDKLAAIAETVRAEGWSWTQAQAHFGYDERGQFRRCFPDEVELPEAEAAELARLEAEHDRLLEAQYDEDGEDDPAVTEQLETLGVRIGELQAQARAWTPEQMEQAGAIVSLSRDGEPEVHRGLIRPEDADEAGGAANDDDRLAPTPTLPATLIEALTSCRTAALRATLARQPDVALAAVTHALARQAFYDYGGETCLQLTLTQRALKETDDCAGAFAFDAERGKWTDRLPAKADDLWTWCIIQTQETLLDLLAVSAAHAIDAVRPKGTSADAPRLLHADQLATALQLDMPAWFRPTGANYFSRVNRTFIMEAMTEAGLPARTRLWAKMTKADLAALAERELAETGWLPQPLRPVGAAAPFDCEQTDRAVAVAA